jgi:hypothetical protein
VIRERHCCQRWLSLGDAVPGERLVKIKVFPVKNRK